jgi:N4-(beta-N-acetylglucosaminyl)-L-asparaginase
MKRPTSNLFIRLFIACMWVYSLAEYAGVEGFNIAINTWSGPFEASATAAYGTLQSGGAALDAVQTGCTACEENQCDGSVGYGNHPDTSGHTTLDALIMDGTTMDAGSVGFVQGYRNVISLARYVLDYTEHTLIVGEGAEQLAKMIGTTPEEPTTTNSSTDIYNRYC